MKIFASLIVILTLFFCGCAQPNEPENTIEDKLEIENYILTENYAIDVTVSDENIFFIEEQTGFKIYDIGGEELICFIDTIATNQIADPEKIAVSEDNDILFVYDRVGSPGNIIFFDISDISDPQWIFNTFGNTSSVDYMRSFDDVDLGAELFWINNDELVHGYYDDQWNAVNTLQVPDLNVNEYLEGFDVTEDFVVIASRQAGIQVAGADLNSVISSFDLLGEAQDVRMHGNNAIVALRQEGFAVVDLGDEVNPELVLMKSAPEFLYTMDIENDLVVFSSHAGGVLLYDISDITDPQLVGHIDKDEIGYTYKVVMKNNKIYAATRKGVYIIGID